MCYITPLITAFAGLLGAGIGGFFTYLATTRVQKKQRELEFQKVRLQLLNEKRGLIQKQISQHQEFSYAGKHELDEKTIHDEYALNSAFLRTYGYLFDTEPINKLLKSLDNCESESEDEQMFSLYYRDGFNSKFREYFHSQIEGIYESIQSILK